MRAWRVRELGDPEGALKLEEIEDPSPEPSPSPWAPRSRGRSRRSPLVGEVVPFEEIPQALMLLGSRSTRGKIVTRRLAALEGTPVVGYPLASASRSGGISSKSSPSTRPVRNPAS